MTAELRRRHQQQIGAEHHQLAVSQVQHPAHAIHEHIPARDQRIDRRQHGHVNGELHSGQKRIHLSVGYATLDLDRLRQSLNATA